MGIGVTSDFHVLGGNQLLETVNHLGTVLLEQVNGTSRDTETYLYLVTVFGDKLLQHGVGGKVASFGQTVG